MMKSDFTIFVADDDPDVRSETTVIADPEDMEIIFNNLVSNAVEYNKPGGRADIKLDKSINFN